MLTTVLTGVGIMIPDPADRATIDRSSGQHESSYVTKSLTAPIPRLVAGLAAALSLLGAAHAQEAVEPEPVIEPAQVVEPEPVIESEAQDEVQAGPADESDVESSSRATPVVDPPSRVARIGYTDGEVTVAPAGTEEWADAVLNRPLTSGDRVWVENGGRAELQIGSSAVYLDGNTGFGFIELDDGVMQASLTEGAATVRVRRLAEGETIQVETPHSTVVLNRVGEYHLEVDKASDRTIVKTRNGEAEVKGGKQRFTVRDNERGVFTGMDNLTGHIEKLGPRTAFENWANDRDGRNERSQSAKYVSRDVIGYEDLDDNGEWISEPEYGYVWRPTYVAYDWAPYRYGRWAYVSPWGWSWIDDARWGFAPFHYGRWAYVRSHWCWVPGPRHIRPVYAPALVGWVGGPSVGVSISFGSNVGWYPLGPRDIFYPGYRYTPRYIRYVNVSNTYYVNNNYFYGRRLPPPHFDHRRYPHAFTAVSRDHFVGGRPIGNHWMRVNDHELSRWRGERQPPAIAPYRESVLASEVRRPPRDADRFNLTRRGGDYFAGRVPFHRERSAIESNGGRPVGRAELHDRNGPKVGGDFRTIRPVGGGGDIKHADRERSSRGLGFNGDNNRAARELNNDSVRGWQTQRNRERNNDTHTRYGNGFSSAPREIERNRDRDDRQRQEIMRGDESRQDGRRRDHMMRMPSDDNRFQGGSNEVTRQPGYRVREPSRGSSAMPRNEPRQWSQPRNEPRRDFTPPPRRDFTPPPRQEPRSQPQPRSEQRALGRSSNHGNSDDGGGSRNNGGNRSWNSPREREK